MTDGLSRGDSRAIWGTIPSILGSSPNKQSQILICLLTVSVNKSCFSVWPVPLDLPSNTTRYLQGSSFTIKITKTPTKHAKKTVFPVFAQFSLQKSSLLMLRTHLRAWQNQTSALGWVLEGGNQKGSQGQSIFNETSGVFDLPRNAFWSGNTAIRRFYGCFLDKNMMFLRHFFRPPHTNHPSQEVRASCRLYRLCWGWPQNGLVLRHFLSGTSSSG